MRIFGLEMIPDPFSEDSLREVSQIFNEKKIRSFVRKCVGFKAKSAIKVDDPTTFMRGSQIFQGKIFISLEEDYQIFRRNNYNFHEDTLKKQSSCLQIFTINNC